MRLWVMLALALAAGAACQKRNISLAGRPCDNGECAEGFTCHPDTDLCVPEVRVGCGEPGALCPSQVQTGDPCDAPDAFLPCCDGVADCRRGCRTCLENNQWSACPACVTGIVSACANCCDDCTLLANVSQVSCSATPACRIDECQLGFADTDGLTSTGCEVQCAPVPDLCDGLDNDCDGLIDRDDTDIADQADLDNNCGTWNCFSCNVDAWACNGACEIGACAPDQWNADGLLSNGCEYNCTETADPTERCDGLDNDCDNRVDTVDTDLDTQSELDDSCAVDRCSACGVANWMCAGNACNIMACDALHKDVDGLPSTGCECAIENDTAFCLRLGKDCGSVTGTDNCGDPRTVSCGSCMDPEICGGGGGSANVCRSWWDCRWSDRRRVTVSTTVALAMGYSVWVELDHAALVSNGQSLAGGDDVRVVRRSGTAWSELPRVADPEPRYGWNQPTTRVWFATEASLSAGGTDNEYFLYYGYAGALNPGFNEAQVFHFADFFDRADSEFVANGWRIIDADTPGEVGDMEIAGSAMFFATPGDYQNRPLAEHGFPEITSALVWRFGFNWARGPESTYRLFMQIGDSSVMTDPPQDSNLALTGTGPSLAWVSENACGGCAHEQLLNLSTLGNVGLGTLSGLHDVTVIADIGTDTFELLVDGGSRGSGLNFYAARARLNKMRFFTWDVSIDVVSRRFAYALVRRYVNPEPAAALAGAEQSNCN